MRRIIPVLLAMLALATVMYAAESKYVELKPGEPVYLNQKKITLIGSSGTGTMLVEVDGVKSTVNKDEEETINGVLFVIDFFVDVESVFVDISTNFSCGDGECASGEHTENCCYDCGCRLNKSCVENQCIDAGLNECSEDSGCDDKNECTVDLCSGLPRKCSNTPITSCENEDGCCLENCTYENDDDCEPPHECKVDADCNDSDTCTTDKCWFGYIRECRYESVTECESGDNCCLPACLSTDDSDCLAFDECNVDEDCTDENGCNTDICNGTPKRCSHIITSCILNESCVKLGEKAASSYCSSDGSLLPLKADGEQCSGDFECTNKCLSEKCATVSGFLTKKTLFIAINAIIIAGIAAMIFFFAKKAKKL